MNYLNEFKKSLDYVYANLDNIEFYGVDTSDFKKRIEQFDKLFDKYDTNSNAAVQVQYTRSQKKDLDVIYKQIKELEKQIIDLNNALGLITYLKENKKRINSNTSKEEISNIVEYVANRLLIFAQNKNTINIELLDDEIETLYQIIKYEYKYNGQSLIMYYMYKNDLLTKKFFDTWEKDCKEIDLIASFNSPYYLNDTIFRIAINEDGYKEDVEVGLKEIQNKYYENKSNSEELKKIIKEKKEKKNQRNKALARIYSGFIPMVLSLSVLIGANIGIHTAVKKSSPYKTTKEIYSSVNDETNTEIGYSRLNVGDTKITLYFPTNENGTRIIQNYDLKVGETPVAITNPTNPDNKTLKAYEPSDYDNIDLSSTNFTSSEYKVDNEANEISTDKFMKVEKVTDIDKEDIKLNVFTNVILSILASGIILTLDTMARRNHTYEDNFHTLVSLLDIPELENTKRNFKKAKVQYPKQVIKYDKEELKRIRRKLIEIKKKYENEYEKYSYMNKYLEEDGYSRRLK